MLAATCNRSPELFRAIILRVGLEICMCCVCCAFCVCVCVCVCVCCVYVCDLPMHHTGSLCWRAFVDAESWASSDHPRIRRVGKSARERRFCHKHLLLLLFFKPRLTHFILSNLFLSFFCAADFNAVHSYCPYMNVGKRNYPSVLLECSGQDSRVPYWQVCFIFFFPHESNSK